MSELAPELGALMSQLGGAAPNPLQREPGELEEVEEEDPMSLISEMVELARDFLDREDVPAQGKRIMEDVTTKLVQIQAAEEKVAQQSPGSLISAPQA